MEEAVEALRPEAQEAVAAAEAVGEAAELRGSSVL